MRLRNRAIAALAVVLVPAVLMVSTIRFRSFKNINFGWGRSFKPFFVFVALIVLIAAEPRVTLVVLAYGYVASAFIEWSLVRLRSHREAPPAASA